MGGMANAGDTKKGKDVRNSAPVAKGETAETPSAGPGSMGRMGAMGGGMAAGAGTPMGGGMAMGGAAGMGGGMAGMRGMAGGMAGAGGMSAGSDGMASMGAAMGGMAGPGPRGRALSLMLVSTATELALRDNNPKSKQIFQKLEEPISMSFNAATPLEDVLRYIKQATTAKDYQGIQIYVDPTGLEEVQKQTTSPVKHLDLEGVPLKTTLRLALKQLGLAYCVRDGVLIISSPQAIFDELRQAQQELDTTKELKELGEAGGEEGKAAQPEAVEP
jgi:hypothetical protein